MGLSSDLISQFVKATKDTTETSKSTTVYGKVVKKDNATYVQLDGSEGRLTPISPTTTDIEDGDRVSVTIKNHIAVITGNFTSPSARTDTVKVIDGKVETNTKKINDFEIIIADKISVDELEAEVARIETLEAENATIKGKLEANEAEIGTLKTDKLDATTANLQYAKVKDLEATDAEIYNLKGTYAEFVDLATEKFEASEADISKLRADMLTVEDADIKYADIDELDAAQAKITNLESDYGDFKNLTAENFKAVNAEIENADLKYANIDFTNIGKATMQYFYAQSGLIKDVTVGDQTITGHLVGVTISGDLIEGNTIKAEKLVIKGSDGLYYQLNTDGMVTEAEQTDQNSLNGSIIRAKSITATKISVEDLVAFGATIGGFHITDNSIYSGVKETVGNNTRGIYLDNEGQIAFGDSSNFVKFYKNASGNYKLAIAADELLLEGSNIGSEVSSLKSKVQWVTDKWIDATTYDQSLWIPFVGDSLYTNYSSRISVTAALNNNSHPSWAAHSSGFSVEFEVEDIGNGWGTNPWNTRILSDKFAHCSVSPVSYTQLGYSSKPILFLRGGGKYRVRTSYECTWTGYPDGYTWTSGEYSQSAPTHTSRPKPLGDSYAKQADMTAAKSKLDQQADSITAVVAKANQNETDIASLKLTNNAFEVRFGTVEGDVDEAIDKATQVQENLDNLSIGGSNLYIIKNSTAGYMDANNPATILGQGPITKEYTSEYIPVAEGENYIFQNWTTISPAMTTDAYLWMAYNFFNSSKESISNRPAKRTANLLPDGRAYDIYEITVPTNAAYMRVSARFFNDGQVKVEKGTVATDWTPAPEDVDSAIDDAQTAASNAQSTANDATTLANNAQSTANSVQTDLASNYTKKTLPDTRNDNQNPQWYFTNYPKQIITEFKYTHVLGLSGETYCTLTTTVPWGESSGGYPKQVAKVGNKEYWRVGTSNTAWGSWNDPAATATNYMKFENNTGLIIGDMTASTLGRNVLIDSDSIDIRKGTSVMASYRDNMILLGANSASAIIDLCSGTGRISASALSEADDFWKLNITSQNSIGLNTGAGELTADNYYESWDGGYAETMIRATATTPWTDDPELYGIQPYVNGVIFLSSHSFDTISWGNNQQTINMSGPTGIVIAQESVPLMRDSLSARVIVKASEEYGYSDPPHVTLEAEETRVTGDLIFETNNERIWGTETDGTKVEVFQAKNSSNNTVIGWGNFNNGRGNTNIYGNDIYFNSAAAVNDKAYRPYYRAGDTITVDLDTAGFVTSSARSVRFVVPLSKPIIGNPVITATSVNGITLRQGGQYTHGSSATTYAAVSSYSVSTTNGGNHVVVQAQINTTTNAVNNESIGIRWSGKLTLSSSTQNVG